MGDQCGLTLVELTVGVAVAVILLTVGASSLRWVVGKNAVAAQVNTLQHAMNFARYSAVMNFGDVILCAGDSTGCNPLGSWNDGYVVFSDKNRDGVLTSTSGDKLLRSWGSPAAAVTIRASARQVAFDENGAASVTAHWRICRDGSDPRGLTLMASGLASLTNPATCELPD